jgi:hypothetical protein
MSRLAGRFCLERLAFKRAIGGVKPLGTFPQPRNQYIKRNTETGIAGTQRL